MKKKQRNIYLDALEYGEKQLIKRQAITPKKLKKYLESEGYKFSTDAEKQLLRDVSHDGFHIYVGDPANRKYFLNTEGYFKLLEYRELSDARKSSKEARTYAIAAILISIATLIASIYFSIRVLEQKIVIDDKQFGVIENIWHNLETINSKKHNKF